MGRRKGTDKTGGRKKGTPNKATTEMRLWIKSFLDNNQAQIEEDFKQLEPHQRIQMFEKLLQYTLPKMQSMKTEIDFNNMAEEHLDAIIMELTKNIE